MFLKIIVCEISFFYLRISRVLMTGAMDICPSVDGGSIRCPSADGQSECGSKTAGMHVSQPMPRACISG